MTSTILHLDSSPLGDASASSGARVLRRDLAAAIAGLARPAA